ncbi:hypothetical protein KJJ36_13905 [Staphylococcus pseudoxylosus]|uniref:hypothetical protein n=1 Tax=Staphylococcus pseudoxylosus TaxID=2282419 RepID=UPI001F1EDEAE|nr:hypothetical protein [Staphylococcus pseudoxylosus]MCE5003461.1 hypothetical protein [Staphylococcus pseudoxylosus]
MTKENNFSIRAASIFCYIFTVVTVYVSFFYTMNKFKLIEANDLMHHLSNATSLIVLVLTWVGAIVFLSVSIMLTVVWIKEDLK